MNIQEYKQLKESEVNEVNESECVNESAQIRLDLLNGVIEKLSSCSIADLRKIHRIITKSEPKDL